MSRVKGYGFGGNLALREFKQPRARLFPATAKAEKSSGAFRQVTVALSDRVLSNRKRLCPVPSPLGRTASQI